MSRRHSCLRKCRSIEYFYFAVIPAQAGIQGLQELGDPRWSLSPQSLGGDGDDGKLVLFDTLNQG